MYEKCYTVYDEFIYYISLILLFAIPDIGIIDCNQFFLIIYSRKRPKIKNIS